MSYVPKVPITNLVPVHEEGGVGTRLLLLPSLDKRLPNTCRGLDYDEVDNSTPGRDRGRIKPATAIVIYGISS